MHDIVAEGAGVLAAVLVGVEARQNLGTKILIPEQPHCPSSCYYCDQLQIGVHLKGVFSEKIAF